MPKAKIEGTHNPMKAASSFFPWKKSISENTSDRMAANKINLSVGVNILNIFFF